MHVDTIVEVNGGLPGSLVKMFLYTCRYVSNRVSIYHFLTCLYTIFDYQGFLQKLEGLFSLLFKNFTKSLLYKSFGSTSNIFIKKFSKYCISDLHIQPAFNKHNHIFYCSMYSQLYLFMKQAQIFGPKKLLVYYEILYTPYISRGFYFREFRESGAIHKFNNTRK